MNDTPPAPLLQPPPTRFSAFPSGSRALDASQSARHATLRRLWDLLHVLLARSSCSDAPSSSHRENASRLLRTWRLLASAREIDLVALWSRAPAVIDAVQLTDADASSDDEAEGERRAAAAAKKAEWLRLGVRRTRSREWPEALLLEYALELVVANELREASEILERETSVLPHNHSVPLLLLAGNVALFVAQKALLDHGEDDQTGDGDEQRAGDPAALARHLRKMRRADSASVSLAARYFVRAARLERKAGDIDGEGTRWVKLMRHGRDADHDAESDLSDLDEQDASKQQQRESSIASSS